jgi:hypothetical protein
MKHFDVFLIICLVSCSKYDKRNIALEGELQVSRWMMEAEINSRFDCYKTIIIDPDTTYDSSNPKGPFQTFYRDFLNLKNTRDSIVSIKTSLTKKEWMDILLRFSHQAESLAGADGSKKEIEEDLRFLKEHFNEIAESEYGELYKHTIERWIRRTYESVLSNAAIDFIEGLRPPCTF